MKKKNLTPEQIAQRDARRAALRSLAKQVSDMQPDARAAFAARAPIVKIDGETLSVFNTCLLMMQSPGATIVGGFRQWLKAGRCVRKGEHGAAIWCPIGAGKNGDQDTGAGAAEPTGAELEAGASVRFILGTVFDVSQTDELTEKKGEE